MKQKVLLSRVTVSPRWAVLAAFLLIVFLFGGGSAARVDSIVLLRPLAALLFVYALWSTKWESYAGFRFPLAMLGAVALLTAIHLVPLPPSIWASLPGRALLVDMGNIAGIAQPWRPLALVPFATWNALFSLLIPAAVMLLMIRCSDEERRKLVWPLLAFGAVSAMLAVLQVVLKDRSLYFFEITNFGSAVGLFANRNHQAVLLACLLPVIATLAAKPNERREIRRGRKWAGLAAALLIIPLILVTGSRAGVLTGLVAIVLSAVLYDTASRTKGESIDLRKRVMFYGSAAVLSLGLAGLFVLFSRAESISRFATATVEPGAVDGSGSRWPLWEALFPLVGKYFPLGSGIGSFVEVFQIDEPGALIHKSYLNHAHNDLLEIAIVAGLPGLLLVVLGVAAFLFAAIQLGFRTNSGHPNIVMGRLGLSIILILGLASLADYPLRTPALMALFAVASIWVARGCAEIANGAGRSANGKLKIL